MLDSLKFPILHGIIIDEYIDILVTCHLVVFVTFLEDGLFASIFLSILEMLNGKKDVGIIYDVLLRSLKE